MTPDATTYKLTAQEQSAIAEARKQETMIKSQLYEIGAQRRKLAKQLDTIAATRNGMLMTVAFQQGLAGNWNLTPDGTALVKE